MQKYLLAAVVAIISVSVLALNIDYAPTVEQPVREAAVKAPIEKQGIRFFQGSFEEALQEAGRQGKPVFVDMHADWCGPCVYMSAEVFPVAEVGEFYNQNFISVKVDVEDERGGEIATAYQVSGLPTLLYLNSDGGVRYEALGGLGVQELLNAGKQALAQ
ncbi:thioredoxin family protein [bacterium SCSIO 12696]|nr:thioredoxin family protein [bacterium SCSIO 12696]